MPMSKLPKSLSSIRARSTSLSNRSQDWSGRTTERSGSKIIAAMMASGPREPGDKQKIEYKRDLRGNIIFENDKAVVEYREGIDSQIETILAKIKRETKRIDKAKAFGTPPVGRETQETADRAAYILRKEGIVNRLFFLLQEMNAEKVKIDERELNKFQNNPRSGEFVGIGEHFVRLEKGKIVPKKQGAVMVTHRNSQSAHMQKVKSMAQLVREEKLKKKTYAPEIQAEIDKVFEPTVSEEDFEAMLNGDDE